MTFLEAVEKEPWRFDYFAVLRHLERELDELPRIGNSTSRRDEIVRFGQDPFMDFPASNLARIALAADKPPRVFVKYMGLLGPQGALPLATTEEAFHNVIAQDDAFPRFLDVFNHRFIQLFYRAWADSRPIVQHDRPSDDRFIAYIGSAIGIGSGPFEGKDSIPDAAKLGFSGLLGPQAKSASRLTDAVCGMFGVDAEVEEFIGHRLEIEPAEWTMLGRSYNLLGDGALLGRTVFSVEDKIRVRIFTRDLAQYVRFLPTGDLCEPLADLVFLYNGEQLDWDTELAIPSGAVEPVRLGHFSQLGWTSWMAPNWAQSSNYRRDARFHPAERMRLKRESQRKAVQPSGRGRQ